MKDFLRQLKAMTWRKSILCAVILFVVYAVLCAFESLPLFFAGIGILIAYAALTAVLLKKDMQGEILFSESDLASGLSLDFVMSLRLPVMIVGFDGTVIWYNNVFSEKIARGSTLYGKFAADTVSDSLTQARIEQLASGASADIYCGGVPFTVSGYKMSSAGKDYCIAVFEDRSALEDTRKELHDRNLTVAYVMLDNVNEVMQTAQDKYRAVSAQAAGVITSWCEEHGGIVREYEKDKYVAFFEEKDLPGILSAKFDILDSIRDMTIDDVRYPVTASVGMSSVSGSLAEKEESARSALENALQRGGDQAVLKTASSTEFFGGRTKTVQKKTKIRSRVVAGELTNLIRQSGNVIIMGHKFCDHDSVASCVAAARIARHLGKEVKIAVNVHDTNLKPIFMKMRGHTYYEDLFTDAVSAQDALRSDTLLIICDVNNPALFESPELFESCLHYAIIDHHRKIQEDYRVPPALLYIEPSASSASELMCEILEYAVPREEIGKIDSELLFAGLILDTGNFKKNTGTKTFSAALFLRSLGAEPDEAQAYFRTSLDELRFEAMLEEDTEIYRDRIAISSSGSDIGNPSRTKLVSSKAADRLLTVTGINAAFVLAVIGRDVNISSRSDGSVNVQLIMEALGGGGHFDAAGAVITESGLEDVKKALKEALDRYFENEKQTAKP